MAIRELPRFKVHMRRAGGKSQHPLLHFEKDRFLPLFSTLETARRFVTWADHGLSGQMKWEELHDFIKGFADIDDLDAILVDHDGTSKKQTVESFPFSNVVVVLNRWKAAGVFDAPILGYSTPREIEAIGWPESSNIFDADDKSEPEMPE